MVRKYEPRHLAKPAALFKPRRQLCANNWLVNDAQELRRPRENIDHDKHVVDCLTHAAFEFRQNVTTAWCQPIELLVTAKSRQKSRFHKRAAWLSRYKARSSGIFQLR